jgi:hypothetical protein
MFDLLKIHNCLIKGSKVILTDIEHKEVLGLHGQVMPISGPLTGPRVEALKRLPSASLAVWGIRFPQETEVVFNARRTSANLDATILQQDQVVLQVGQSTSRHELQQPVPNPLPSGRLQRKLFCCPFCSTSRTFSDEEKLRQHLRSDH